MAKTPDQPALEEAPERDLAAELENLKGMLDEVLANSGTALQALGRAINERDQAEHRAMVATIPRTLDERMAAVQLELEDVARAGHAEVQTRSGNTYTYDYITEADLMKGIRPLLAKHGIATYYSDRIVSIDNGMARVEVELTLRANGESIVLHGEGVGTDTGDKHANKAKTSAMRYLLWKTFLQPSDEDPEQENVSADQAAGAEQGRREQASRTTTRATRRTDPQQRRGELLQRINQLAVDLDEVQGQPAGAGLSKIHEAVAEHGKPITAVEDSYLVKIGTALAAHLTSERHDAEKEGYTPAVFEVPAP